MFPPQRTADARKFIENALASLARGGLEVVGDIGLDAIEHEKYSVMVRVPTGVSKESWPFLRSYLQQYAQASGWRVEKARQVRGALLLIVSRA